MANTDRPNLTAIYCVCQQYIYYDADVPEVAAAVYDNWDVSSSEDIAARVLDYLSTHKPHANNWDMLPLQMAAPDPHAAQAFSEIFHYKELLQLRCVEGRSLSAIATYYGSSTKQVEILLTQVRLKFWSAYVLAEETTLRLCRQYLYTNSYAQSTAMAVYQKNVGTPSSDVRHCRVLAHLMATQRYTGNWDTLAWQIQSRNAGTLDSHAQKAFDSLERADIKFLCSRVDEGYTLSDIAKKYGQKEKEVKAKLQNLRSKFWGVYVSSEQETLRACRRYMYADGDAVEAAIAIRRENTQVPSCPEQLDTNVRAYLSATDLDADAWDLLPEHIEQQGTPVEKASNSLQVTDRNLLALRLIEGKSIEEIADHLGLAVDGVAGRLAELRTLLWSTDDTVLRECRRFIHDDTDAERIAAVMYKQGTPNLEDLREYVRESLIASWDPLPSWNDPFLSELIAVLNNPTDKPVPGIPAAAIAYNALTETGQKLLKLKIEGASNWDISRQLDERINTVNSHANEARKMFWETFTRERWSTLPYFIEFFSTQSTHDPSHEILKVEKEYEASITAYNSLMEAGQTLLEKRCIYGKSLAEIAGEEKKSVEWVFDELQRLRQQFRNQFQATLFPDEPSVSNHTASGNVNKRNQDVSIWDEDDVVDARAKFLLNFYKYIPENYKAWFKTATRRIKNARIEVERKISEAIDKNGTIVQVPVYDDDGNQVGITTTRTIGGGPEPEEPLSRIVKDEEREKHLARSPKLLQEALDRVKEMSMPEKKMFALVKYFLRETLDAHEAVTKLREHRDPQEKGASSLTDEFPDGLQLLVATVVDRDLRSVRRWKNENIRLTLAEACEAIGMEFHELEKKNPHIHGTDIIKERERKQKQKQKQRKS